MPTFIKAGFWEKAVKGFKGWLDLDQWFSSLFTPAFNAALAVAKPYSETVLNVKQDDITGNFIVTVLQDEIGYTGVTNLALGSGRLNFSKVLNPNKTMVITRSVPIVPASSVIGVFNVLNNSAATNLILRVTDQSGNGDAYLVSGYSASVIVRLYK